MFSMALQIALLRVTYLNACLFFHNQQSPSDPDTLANIITVSYHLQRSNDVINRYLK